MTSTNPYDIPGQRPASEPHTPPPAASPTSSAPNFAAPARRIQWLTVGLGVIITGLWGYGIKTWGIDTVIDLGIAVLGLLFVFWLLGLPAYLVASRALADKEITANELKAMFNWPVEVALLAMSGGLLRDNNGHLQFARQIDREDDDSKTIAKGLGAYTLVIGFAVLAALSIIGLIYFTLSVILSLVVLAFFVYTGGGLFYFWTCGLIREPLSGKLAWTLAVYPLDMFKRIAGTG